MTYERLKADGLFPIDIITGGYPCQPFSVAGRKKGEKDPRHLWPEYFRLIKELRPTWVIGENVSGHIKLGLDTVLENLESEGYAVRTFSIPASAVGANHKRERVWIVAYSERNDNLQEKQRVNGEKEEIQREHWKKDSDTRKPSGTDSIRETSNEYVADANNTRNRTPQYEINKNGEKTNEGWKRQSQPQFSRQGEDMENTRRSLRQGSEFRGENENEIRQGNANISERSSEASEFDVANTEGKYNSEQEGKIKSRGKIIEGRETEIRSESTGRSNTLANTKSSQRNGNAINREHSETETQEEFGVGSSISRTQGGSPWEGWWDIEPDVGRVAHGIPVRAHRLKGLGNSLVPTIPFYIGTIILEVMKDDG